MILISLSNYLTNIKSTGKVVYPATGYLLLVWETFGMMIGLHHLKVPVEIEDVKFAQATFMEENVEVLLQIVIHKGKRQILTEEFSRKILKIYP